MKDGLVCIPPLAGEVMWGGGVGEIADGGGFVFLPLSRRECQDDEYAEWVGDIQRVPTQKTKKNPQNPTLDRSTHIGRKHAMLFVLFVVCTC